MLHNKHTVVFDSNSLSNQLTHKHNEMYPYNMNQQDALFTFNLFQ